MKTLIPKRVNLSEKELSENEDSGLIECGLSAKFSIGWAQTRDQKNDHTARPKSHFPRKLPGANLSQIRVRTSWALSLSLESE